MNKKHNNLKNCQSARVWTKGMLLAGAGTLLMTACAVDGYDDDERFVSDVTGATLASPSAETITVTPSADGKTQTISWPVVKGAGGYLVNFIDEGNPAEPIVKDSLVDGCSVTVKREEDMNYLLTIKTMGRKDANNQDASSATEMKISTFTPTYKTIPAGSDLKAWFEANPAPAGENHNFDLEGGAEYTLSGLLDFGASSVTLRSNNKAVPAKIIFTDNSSELSTSGGLVLKYLNIDCSASSQAFISLSRNPAIAPVIVNAWSADYNFYRVKDNISVLSCHITGVNSYFIWDNQVSCWFADNVLVDNCLVHLTTPSNSKALSGGYFWTNKGAGFFRNLTVSNSTFYNTGEGDVKYFVQYGGFGNDQVKDPDTQFGWTENTITYQNCTFYHVCASGQWGNYNGVAGKKTSYWNLKNCIFYDCSSSGVARRFLAGKQNQPTATFENNTYMHPDGTFDNPSNYDTSGTNIDEDPGFRDPAKADFTISNPTHINRKCGDPRWLP
jgi:hypothetical protein